MTRFLAALAVGLLLAVPLAAQEAQAYQGVLATLTDLWSQGDASGLAAHGARAGLDLEVHGQTMGSLQGRRAAAALRQLFGTQETVGVRAGSSAKVEGTDDRAFAELLWEVRMPGAQVTETHRVFVGLVMEERSWRVSQIRILP